MRDGLGEACMTRVLASRALIGLRCRNLSVGALELGSGVARVLHRAAWRFGAAPREGRRHRRPSSRPLEAAHDWTWEEWYATGGLPRACFSGSRYLSYLFHLFTELAYSGWRTCTLLAVRTGLCVS